jgi:hypothetical protein
MIYYDFYNYFVAKTKRNIEFITNKIKSIKVKKSKAIRVTGLGGP